MNCPTLDDLFAHLEKEVSVSMASDIEKHLSGCKKCSKRWSEIKTITTTIESQSGEFNNPDFVKNVVSKIQPGKAQTKKRWFISTRWFIPTVAALTVAGLLLVVLPWNINLDFKYHDGFTSRGSVGNDTERWVSFQVFKSEPDSKVYADVKEEITTNDHLVFSVTNSPKSPYQYLMILGVHNDGGVFWYHPAFINPKSNPKSIPITNSTNPIHLREEISHDLHPGRLRIISLFSKEPLTVLYVEKVIAATLDDSNFVELERLPIAETGQQSILLRVITGLSPQ